MACFDYDTFNAGAKDLLSTHSYLFFFFNKPLIIGDDEKHSQNEKRYFTLGQTDNVRLLFIVSTIRENLIRVISARDMNKKEREVYQQ